MFICEIYVCKGDIGLSFDGCVKKLKTKYKFRNSDLNDWKDFVKQEVSKKIKIRLIKNKKNIEKTRKLK